MTGYALPLTVLVHPGIGEPSIVLEGLALVGPLRMVRSDYDRNIRIRDHSCILIGNQAGTIVWIFQVGKKLCLIHHGAVVVGIHEGIGDQAVYSLRIAMTLSLFPAILQGADLARIRRAVIHLIPR